MQNQPLKDHSLPLSNSEALNPTNKINYTYQVKNESSLLFIKSIL